MKNIILIGFMGTGKTVVGRRLARILKRDFVDTDAEIERATGKSIRQLFAEEGEARFRSEESILCAKLARQEGLVIATGGGIVLNPQNVDRLREAGILIGLSADPEVILQRVGLRGNRPLLRGGNKLERIKELLRERAGAYDVAEFTLDTNFGTPEQNARAIVDYLRERGYI
ncbi:MAG: shikimate kinase [Eubacteriales bacterium]|nr:shikimate kinase [Bacillota bacterium]MBV1727240.1 shikimate kinase [Desulforudis sp.]MDQ7788494.1 shikimate kinase [Clostridia bacterium]MDZ4043176.1 shikimate kinase [Eubacteriales bacterium]MBU4532113.1 shikimate kinase [Bacillota bacterium]